MNDSQFINEITHELSSENHKILHRISVDISELKAEEFYHFVFPVPINSDNFNLINQSEFSENIHIQILQKSNSFHFCFHSKNDIVSLNIDFTFSSEFVIRNNKRAFILPNIVYFEENGEAHKFNQISNREEIDNYPVYKILINNFEKIENQEIFRKNNSFHLEFEDFHFEQSKEIELSSNVILIIAESDANPDDFKNELNKIRRIDRVNIFSTKSRKWLFPTPRPLLSSDVNLALEFIENAENKIINQNNFNFLSSINFDYENANFIYLYGEHPDNYYGGLSNQFNSSPFELKNRELFSSKGSDGIFSHSLSFSNNFQSIFSQEDYNFYYPFFETKGEILLRQIRRRRIYDPGIDYELKYEFRAFGFDYDASGKVEEYFKKYSNKLFELLKAEMNDGDLEKMCTYSLNLDSNGSVISFARKTSNFSKQSIFDFVEEMLSSIDIDFKGISSENLYICLFDVFYG
jgi:hypothetical protein